MNTGKKVPLLFSSLLFCAGVGAGPIGTEFIYQGRLNSGGSAVSGVYDFRFALFDELTSGNLVGERLDLLAVPVTNGLFNVTLDFGDVFDGASRWLQIGVKTNGAGSFATLAPRQPLQATPHASYARDAASAATVPNSAITSVKIADGAITSGKIAPGAVKLSAIDDGGSSAYESSLEAKSLLNSGSILPLSALALAVSNSGPAILSFTVDGATVGTVMSFAGDEGISSPYQFLVVANLPAPTLNTDGQLGRQGRLTFSRNGRSTIYTGVITACALSSGTGTNALYSFRLESPLAYLALSSGYKVFQNQSRPEVAAAILQDLTSATMTSALRNSYDQREAIIQFGEPALNFFHRLLEEEGIFYFFVHGGAAPALTIGDSTDAYQSAPNSPFRYFGNFATNVPSGVEYIRTFQKSRRESTLVARINSYDFQKPSVSLDGTHSNPAGGHGEQYEFDYSRSTGAEIDLATTRRAERFELEHAALFGSANAPDLRPGYVFTLDDQSGAGVNGSYLVTSVRHAAFRRVANGVASIYYGNEFEAAPSTLAFRPARKTPRPEARTCTAVVTGPAGEEIYTDKYGRVKVHFHWDINGTQDERSSMWIRVSTLWAGEGWGTLFIPRVGQEVLVSFLQGDPDRPVVTGALYNASRMVPYALPGNQTQSGIKSRSSKGGTGLTYNEIRFEDKKGSEELWIKAQKDLTVSVGNDKKVAIGHDAAISVANDFTASVANHAVLASPSIALGTLANPTFVNVNGALAATTLQGSGAGLTDLPAGNLTGTVQDTRLSTNVARLDATQTFSAPNSFWGPIGLGGAAAADALNIYGDARLNKRDVFLREGADTNHGLGWYGLTKLFSGVNVDGPVIYGCDGGGLGVACSNPKLALRWRSDGNVTIDPQNMNAGGLVPGITFGNNASEGISSRRAAGGNGFGLDLYTSNQIRVTISASGNVGIGKTNPAAALDVAGPIRTASAIRSGIETGTAQGPSYPAGSDGLVIRRARSTSPISGSIVARTDKLTLQRDGTSAGLRIAYVASPGYQLITCIGINTNGTQIVYRNALPNPAVAGTLAIFSDAQKIVHYDVSFGDTFSTTPGHTARVVLDRYDDGATSDSYLVGTITSTYNQ